MDSFFTADRMADLGPRLQPVAAEAVAALPPDTEVDAIGQLGSPYAVRATCTWLGWPPSLEGELLQWMRDNHAAARGRRRGP